jgi:hypothetical protein
MRVLSLGVIICLFSIKVKAQNDTDSTETKKTTITAAALYSNNVNYYGQTTAEKLPYVLVNVTVRLPVGLYFSAGSYKLLNVGSGISETDLGIGYDHDFSERFTAGIGYSRSFYPKNSPLLQASNENNVNLSADYYWPWFKSSLSVDYAFGQESDLFTGLTNSKLIELGTLFNKKNQISIEPSIEIVAGTQHFLKTYTEQKNKKNNGKGNGNGNSNSTITTTLPAISFELLSYNFKIPLSYSRANYMAEVSYQFSVLGANAITEAKRHQSFISLGFYYQF